MKTIQEIQNKIKAHCVDYIHTEYDYKAIYKNLCAIYGSENVHDGEEPFLSDCIEAEIEAFFNN